MSDLMRHPRGSVARRIEAVGHANVRTSVIVTSELLFGIERRNALRLEAQLKNILEVMEVAPFEPPADVQYGRVRTDLQNRGLLIGPMDLLIAAHALALGDILVSGNVAEFSRVSYLKLENWLA